MTGQSYTCSCCCRNRVGQSVDMVDVQKIFEHKIFTLFVKERGAADVGTPQQSVKILCSKSAAVTSTMATDWPTRCLRERPQCIRFYDCQRTRSAAADNVCVLYWALSWRWWWWSRLKNDAMGDNNNNEGMGFAEERNSGEVTPPAAAQATFAPPRVAQHDRNHHHICWTKEQNSPAASDITE